MMKRRRRPTAAQIHPRMTLAQARLMKMVIAATRMAPTLMKGVLPSHGRHFCLHSCHVVMFIYLLFFRNGPQNDAPGDADAQPAPPVDPSVKAVAHGVQWRDKGEVTVNLNGPSQYTRKTHLSTPLKDGDTELDVFRMFFPEETILSIIAGTNQQAEMIGDNGLDEEKTYRFLGCLLAQALAPMNTERRDMWAPSTPERLLPSMDLGRFMPRDAFDRILRNLRLAPSTEAQIKEDAWFPIRALVHAFNANREKTVVPGPTITVDESMSVWKGLSLKVKSALGCPDADTQMEVCVGLPHQTKIIRKPVGVGTELKNVADGQTRIMLRLEIQEAKEKMKDAAWMREYGAGTSMVMRLCKPWFASDRTVVADSAFASVKTARALQEKCGLRFIGMVKTAHREFPLSYLSKTPLPTRGQHAVLQTQIGGHDYMGIAWADRKRKMLVATTGNTGSGDPALKKRMRMSTLADNTDAPFVKYFKEVPRPAIVQQYFAASNAIDVHNHYRQGGLQLEVAWRTHNWVHRLFATVLGICETDAYLAISQLHPQRNTTMKMAHRVFTERLVLQLQFSSVPVHQPGPAARTRRAHTQPATLDVAVVYSTQARAVSAHTVVGNMRSRPYFKQKRPSISNPRKSIPTDSEQNQNGGQDGGQLHTIQRKCSVCGARRTSKFCSQCSDTSRKIVPICDPGFTPAGQTSCPARHVDMFVGGGQAGAQ